MEPHLTLKTKFLIFAFVAVLCLVTGELLVRIISTKKLFYNIEMVKYAKELKIPDPEGIASHMHRPNASAVLMGTEIKLNSLGNRGPDLGVKSKDTKRILVLGSSVTMGWGLPEEKMFTYITQRELNEQLASSGRKVEIANAGIGNYNTRFQIALFNRQYPILKPDIVVLHYFISDAETRGKGNNSLLLKYSYLADLFYDQISNLSFKAGSVGDLATYYRDLYADNSPNWRATLDIIKNLNDTLSRDKVPLLIMIVPDFHNLNKNSSYKSIYEKIYSDFSKLHIPVINMFENFSDTYSEHESDLWIQADDPHPNDKGHELMAKLLTDLLGAYIK